MEYFTRRIMKWNGSDFDFEISLYERTIKENGEEKLNGYFVRTSSVFSETSGTIHKTFSEGFDSFQYSINGISEDYQISGETITYVEKDELFESMNEEITNIIEEGRVAGMPTADDILIHAEALVNETPKGYKITKDDLHIYIASNYIHDLTIDHINAYLEDNKYFDDMAHSMYDLDEYLAGYSPTSIISMVGDKFDYCDELFYFDGYGFLESSSEADFINRWADGCIAWMIDEGELDDFADAQEILDCEGIIVEYANRIKLLG